MSARDDILAKLRASLAQPQLPFPAPDPPALNHASRPHVTSFIGDLPTLANRFGQELAKVAGSYEIASSESTARLMCVSRLTEWIEEDTNTQKGVAFVTGQETSVLCWQPEALGVDGLQEALETMEITMVFPVELQTEESRDAVRHIRYGLTGVTAACATTGTMIMATSTPGTSRAASLLPYRHIALIPFSKLYPSLEMWMSELRQQDKLIDLMRSHANITLITGPSKSADIEGNLTLGVHGPKNVHAILFDDG